VKGFVQANVYPNLEEYIKNVFKCRKRRNLSEKYYLPGLAKRTMTEFMEAAAKADKVPTFRIRLLNPSFLSSTERISMLLGEVFGLVGGALTTFGYVPQFARILKLKSAREISLPFTLSFLAGATCWLAYGALLSLMPVILWNSAGIIFLSMLLYGKLKYGR
jgi:MtN3 and saliva related transmembrane protein